ncbi:MAG: hemolysin family protein [Planctomycetota bacterium]|nr:hemolysin family protein [Planctomycetota bacterium]
MEVLLFGSAAAVVVLSGFFSLNAWALRDPSRHNLESAFSARSRRLDKFLEHLSELRMVCGLLRSACNLSLLVLLLFAFDSWFDSRPVAVLVAVSVTAGLISVFVVAIPHAWARYAGEKVLSITAGMLLGLRRVLWPVMVVMRAFDVPVRRLSGVPDPRDNQSGNGADEDELSRMETAVKAEILQVASDAQAEGAVDAEEMEMIESVIEFGDSRAGEIVTPRTDIVALPAEATLEEVRRTVIQAGHTRIPVYAGDIDNIVGILYAKDLLTITEPDKSDLRSVMRKPFFVPETKPLDDLLREFKARKMHMAIVLDEYGGTTGLITIEDLIEEIVGDISDEYDQTESPLLKRIDEQTAEVDGRMYVDDFNDAMGLSLPEEEDYETVAGFVFSELGFIPPVGQTLSTNGAEFSVLAADARKITRLRVVVRSS